MVFAHRGGAALGPENTLVAFDRGLAAGADGIELDVHLSRDGVVVVHHDDTLDRTTAASGPVAACTAAELARVDAAFHFVAASGYPLRGEGVGVPTLREALARYRDTRVIIEMKRDDSAMGLAVVEEIRRADAVERVCVAGEGGRALRAARSALPEVASSACRQEVRWALYRSHLRCPVARARYGGYQVPERASGHTIVSPRFLRHAHAAGLRVQVWTVDEADDMRRLLGWGVDALISNRPDMAVAVRSGSRIQAPVDPGRV